MRSYGAHDAGAAGRISIGEERRIDPERRQAWETEEGCHMQARVYLLCACRYACQVCYQLGISLAGRVEFDIKYLIISSSACMASVWM